jgi:hypothetical protein
VKSFKLILIVAFAIVGMTIALTWGTVGEAGGAKSQKPDGGSDKFMLKVIGQLGVPPEAFCPSETNLFGFSGDVFAEDDDPVADDPIGIYDACVQSFTGNPFEGGGTAQLNARFVLDDGTISVTCTCYPTLSAKAPEVDGNVLFSFTSGVGSITGADGAYADATSASTVIGAGESEIAFDPASPIGMRPVRERAFFYLNLQLDGS